MPYQHLPEDCQEHPGLLAGPFRRLHYRCHYQRCYRYYHDCHNDGDGGDDDRSGSDGNSHGNNKAEVQIERKVKGCPGIVGGCYSSCVYTFV